MSENEEKRVVSADEFLEEEQIQKSLRPKFFNEYNEIEQKHIFNTIIQVNPKWQNKWSMGKYNGNYRGLQKY